MAELFIVVEGPDGSGKTTCSKLLVEKMNEMGIKTEYTREPGGVNDDTSQLLRKLLKETNLSNNVASLLFAASQRYTLEKFIIPKIYGYHQDQASVVCDRFTRSIEIYQGFYKVIRDPIIENIKNRADFVHLVKHIYELNSFYIKYPDYEFVLQIDFDKAYERIKSRGINENDIRESDIDFLKETNKAYNLKESLSDMIPLRPSKIYKIDVTNLSPDEVVNEMLSKIMDKYKNDKF